MKKAMLTLAMVLAIGTAGYQIADARPGYGGGHGMGGGAPYANLDEEALKAREAFYAATTELRKKITVKQSQLRAVMQGDNPDEAKVAALSGELFDLRNEMRSKAQEAGIRQGGCLGGGAGGMMGHGGQGTWGHGPGMRGAGPGYNS